MITLVCLSENFLGLFSEYPWKLQLNGHGILLKTDRPCPQDNLHMPPDYRQIPLTGNIGQTVQTID